MSKWSLYNKVENKRIQGISEIISMLLGEKMYQIYFSFKCFQKRDPIKCPDSLKVHKHTHTQKHKVKKHRKAIDLGNICQTSLMSQGCKLKWIALLKPIRETVRWNNGTERWQALQRNSSQNPTTALYVGHIKAFTENSES